MTPAQQALYNMERARDVLSFIISQLADSEVKEIEFYTQEEDAVISNDAAAIQRVMSIYYPKVKDAYEQYRTAPITEEERQSRQKAFDYACASVELEGLKISDEYKAYARRYINGEIDMPTFVARI